MPRPSRQLGYWSRHRTALFIALGAVIWLLVAAGAFLLARWLTA
ncbi:hypothetical protein [Brevundimonas sp. UBA7534]|nr:hypothetical protein [Brevundimonas sp. UBA7534]